MIALAKVYLEAAARLDGEIAAFGNGACDAILHGCEDLDDSVEGYAAADLMCEMYEPDAIRAGTRLLYWGANFGAPSPDSYEIDPEEAKQCRVLMLLFMSAMAEAGDI